MTTFDIRNRELTFSNLYSKTARHLGGRNGRVSGGTKLYATSKAAGKYSFDTRPSFSPLSSDGKHFGASVVHSAIQQEYGADVADRVFRKVIGKDSRDAEVSLDTMQKLKDALSYERRKLQRSRDNRRSQTSEPFSTMADRVDEAVSGRSLSKGRHLRFTNGKGIYFHTAGVSSTLGLHNLWGATPASKRSAAGAQVWRALAEQFDGGTADRIFRSVFGARAVTGRGAPRVAVTRRQFEVIRALAANEKALANDVATARDIVRQDTNRNAGTPRELLRSAILGDSFAERDATLVARDLAALRKEPRFKGMDIYALATHLETLDVDRDPRLQQAPEVIKERMRMRLEALRAHVRAAVSNEPERQSEIDGWEKTSKSYRDRMRKEDLTADELNDLGDRLLGMLRSNAHLPARALAHDALELGLAGVRSRALGVAEAQQRLSEAFEQLRPAIEREVAEKNYRVETDRATRYGDKNHRSLASRRIKPVWSAINLPKEDIGGVSYRVRPESSKFRPPPPISRLASTLAPNKGPVADVLEELRQHLTTHGNVNDPEVIFDASEQGRAKPLTWQSFEQIWRSRFGDKWNDRNFRELGTAYQMRRSMEHVLSQKTSSERAHALATFVMNSATCAYGVEQGILNYYTREVAGQTNLDEDQVAHQGDRERYRGGIETVLQKRRQDVFTNDELSTHILGDQLMQDRRIDPVHQRTFLQNAIGNHVGVQSDRQFRQDVYAQGHTNDNVARMPQYQMLELFHEVYTPKAMVAVVKDHINDLLSNPKQQIRNREFQRLQEAFFSDGAADYLTFEMTEPNDRNQTPETHYGITDLGAAKILQDLGHLEPVANN